MENEALPVAADQAAGAGETPQGDAPEVLADGVQPEAEQAEGDKPAEGEKKPEKSAEQRMIDKLEKRIGKMFGQRETSRIEAAQAKAEAEQMRRELNRLRGAEIGDTNGSEQVDSVSLSKLAPAELERLIEERADKRAQTIATRRADEAKLAESARKLQASLGERFTALTGAVAAVIPDERKQFMLLRVSEPQAVIEYLADPDNEDTAEEMASLDDFSYGVRLGQLSVELKTKKASAVAEPSKAPAPLEAAKGRGATQSTPDFSNMTDAEWSEWRAKQKRRA